MFQQIYELVNSSITSFVSQNAQSIIGIIEGPVRSAVILYLILYGIAILRGSIDEPLFDFCVRAMKIVAITELALNYDTYNTYVGELFFTSVPNQIIAATTGGSGTSPVDDLFRYGGQAAEAAYQNGGTFDGPIMWAVIWICTAVSAAVALGITLLARVFLGLIISFGPLFIAFALFEATRRWTFGWLNAIVTAIALQVFVIGNGVLTVTVLGKVQELAAIEGAPTSATVAVIACVLVCAFLYSLLPTIAAQVASGPALAGNPVTAAMKWTATAAAPAMAKAARQLAGAARELRSSGGSIKGA